MSDESKRVDEATGLDPRTILAIQTMASAMMEPIIKSLRELTGPPRTQQPALPAQQKSERAQLIEVVDEHSYRTRERHDDVWRWLYRQWQRYGHGDVQATARARACKPLDLIESNGQMCALLDVARRELPGKPRSLDLLSSAQTPTPRRPRGSNEALRGALTAAGMSAGQLATAAGLSTNTIEKALGGYIPGRASKKKIAGALGKLPADLWTTT